jgi:glycosyltransferase involved in cell wall biosynthesis
VAEIGRGIMRRDFPANFPLQIVGDGPGHGALEADAGELRLAGITLRACLSREEAIAKVDGARFLVVPSTGPEGFPMGIAEFSASGTPVLCPHRGAMKEIVMDQVTGLHFAPGEAMDLDGKLLWAWEHPKELAAMGREARSQSERSYAPEKNYKLLMNIYELALEGPALSPVPVASLN